MAFPAVTYSITNGTPNDGSQVAQNFTDLVNGFSDGTKDINVMAITGNGAVTLGASSSNDLTLNAALASTIAVKTNATYAFGSATKGLTVYYLGNSTYTIGLTCPSLSASYTLTLPTAVPASTSLVTMSAAGALATSLTPTVTSITIGSATASYASTSPALGRVLIDATLQLGAGNAILGATSNGRTLVVRDATTSTSAPIVTSAVPATHGLHIVRGQIPAAGTTATTGEGFTYTHSNGTGLYAFTFTTAFADAPAIVITLNDGSAEAWFDNLAVSGFRAVINGGSDCAFSFIAIGQRGA